MKRISLFVLVAAVAVCTFAATPNGSGTYYSAADGKTGAQLKTALCGIIYNRTEKSYNYLWTAFKTTDVRSNGKIWDMYSNITNYTPVTSGSSYSDEDDCYNREHSFPQSWFGSNTPMYTDLHHIYPTDGKVNGMRANYPFGETNGETYKSANNFSKLGACTYPGYTGRVFEPADEYKGDFARTYFYMVTCYEEKLADWYAGNADGVRATIDGTKYPAFQTWQLNMLMEWATADPVSEKEINRNNAVYGIQNNRNPFIDYPGLEQYIWGSKKDDAFSYNNYVQPDGSSSGSGSGGEGGETPVEVTDVINREFTGVTKNTTSYSSWSGKNGSSSSAVYAGNSAGGNNSVQLRSSSSSGIVSTTSGGTVTKVKVTWNANTTSGRKLDIYGKSTAYSAASELYNNSNQGTKLGSIVYGTSTELTITGDYAYVGLRSNDGAMYLSKIEITWENNNTPAVKTDPSFNNLTDVNVNFGSTLTLTKGTTDTPNFVTDGTVTLESSNTDVVTVDGLTITPVAVGTALITVNTTATTAYNAGSVMFPITVNAPEGGTTAFVEETTATLDFTTNSWGLPTSGVTASQSYTDNQGYTITLEASTAYYYNTQDKYLMLGKSGSTLTLPAFDKAVTQIDVVGRTGASTNVRQRIYVDNIHVSTETTGAEGTNSYEIMKLFRSAGTIYKLKVMNAYSTQITSIIVHFASNTLSATLNSSGYATYCSEYPLDFTGYETANYSAWQITGVNGETITFSQITGTVKGGTGILLKGEANADVTLTSSASSTTLGDNLLVGTLAPTYVASGDYYGLSGNEFVRVNAGTVDAGKALLPVSAVGGDEVKSFVFVFEDEETGIKDLKDFRDSKDSKVIYNLAGQMVNGKLPKGIYIVNGKKVLKVGSIN